MRRSLDPVRDLCDRLARRHAAAGLLDWIARWIVPPGASPAFAGVPTGAVTPGPAPRNDGPILMAAEGPGTAGRGPTAPTKPHDHHHSDNPPVTNDRWDYTPEEATHRHEKREANRKHVDAVCNDPKYRGMHGRPCKHAGGTDNQCPKGTTSGWFWKYDTPVGTVYYVDCCGKSIGNAVWCNWTNEQNWCVAAGQGAGRASRMGAVIYSCTLAILSKDMKTRDVGGKTETKLEVVGVDPE